MKKVISFVVILLIVAGTAAAVYLSQETKKDQSSNSSSAAVENVCVINDIATLQQCKNNLTSEKYDEIQIASQINCTSREDCYFLFENLDFPITITGTSADAGFYRLGNDFSYEILIFANSKSVKISNLKFSDDSDATCDALDTVNCRPPIYIGDTPAEIDNLSFYKTKRLAIEPVSTNKPLNLTIKNSSFTEVTAHAIVNYNTQTTGHISLENNKFINNINNAVALSIPSSEDNKSSIKNNIFIHNHNTAIYNMCGESGKEPCPGGQLYIMAGTRNLNIDGNNFKDGYLVYPTAANNGYGVGGIEIDVNDVQNVFIKNNIFTNNETGILVNCNNNLPLTTTNIAIYDSNTFENNKYSNVNICNSTIGNNPDVIKFIEENVVAGNDNCASQDINSDKKITLIDISSLLSKYNTSCEVSNEDNGACGSQDSNNDGKISLVDLSNLLSKYNKGCE